MSAPGTDDFLEQLYRARRFDEAFAAFDRQVTSLGFEGVLYTFIPQLAIDFRFPQRPVYAVSGGYDPDYLDHYAQARFDRDDPIVKAVANGRMQPLDWWLEVDKGQMATREKAVIVTAREDYRLINGLTLPMLCDTRGVAGVSVVSSETGALYDQLKAERMRSLRISSIAFHGFVMSNSALVKPFLQPLLASLNPTERRLLARMAAGRSVQQIATDMNSSVRYLDKVLRHAREKFSGVTAEHGSKVNRNQLLYYLGLMNLLDHLSD